MNYELHPLCTLFPRLSGSDLDELAGDIKINGLRQPIVIHDGMILDGGNRYAACLKSGIKPVFSEFDGSDAVAFVLSMNLHRRHMKVAQFATITSLAQDWGKANKRGGDRKSDQSATLHFDTPEQRAAASGAGLRTQKKADKVAKADPELAKQVAHGDVSLDKAVHIVDSKTAKRKPAAKPQSKPAPDLHLVTELQSVKDQLAETQDNAKELARDLERYTAIEQGEADKIIKRLQVENDTLKHRINAITTECKEAVKTAQYWRKQAEKLGYKAAA